MLLEVKMRIILSESFSSYERLVLADNLLGHIRAIVKGTRGCSLESAKGEISPLQVPCEYEI